MIRQSSESNKNESTKKEVRKGFHPALVISTVAVIIFVLWFCPYYLMRARIDQTEARASEALQKNRFIKSTKNSEVNGAVELTPEKKYTDYHFYKTTSNPAITYAIPAYYGRTAIFTFCIKDGDIYKKDIKGISSRSKLPELDSTWQNTTEG